MLTIFFTSPTGLPPPLLVPCTKMVYNTTSYLDKHICKQMSIILFLTDVFFLQNYIVPNNLFLVAAWQRAPSVFLV